MGKLLRYLRTEGVAVTLKKVTAKLFQNRSVTIFYQCSNMPETDTKEQQIQFIILTEDRLQEFEAMKFFEHLDAAAYCAGGNSRILLAVKQDEIVGYAAAEWEKLHEIHGLGHFSLEKGEAWIGPVYVKREYRGQGINATLLRTLGSDLQRYYHLHTFYTAINEKNAASRKSFSNCGFLQFGNVFVNRRRSTESCSVLLQKRFEE